MNSLDVINFWISSRYREKPKTIEWINATGIQLEKCSDFYSSCTLNVESSSGDQLDLIGSIIGIERIYISSTLSYFGYDTIGATGYNMSSYIDIDNLELVPISDYFYKIIIKLKIYFNSSDCTRDNIILATQRLFNISDVELIDNEDMSFRVILHEKVDEVMVLFLNRYKIFLKPAGVGFIGYESEGL